MLQPVLIGRLHNTVENQHAVRISNLAQIMVFRLHCSTL